MPSSRSARSTRTASSPRLATSTLRKVRRGISAIVAAMLTRLGLTGLSARRRDAGTLPQVARRRHRQRQLALLHPLAVPLDTHVEELLEQPLHERHVEDATGERGDHRRAHALERRLGGEDADERRVVVADDVAAEAVEAAAREALVAREVAGVDAALALQESGDVVGRARPGGEGQGQTRRATP